MKVLSYLFAILLIPSVIILSFRMLVFNTAFYQEQFEKVQTYRQIDKSVADFQANNLINYFCCKDNINTGFYSENEIQHLKDVKVLIKFANNHLTLHIAFLIIIAAILIIRKKYDLLAFGLLLGSVVGIFAIFALAISSILNFSLLFEKFHVISFDNDLWLLPPDANLIKLFPQQFFQNFANRIALQSVAIFLILILISRYLRHDCKIR